jgi:hypothetical protein
MWMHFVKYGREQTHVPFTVQEAEPFKGNETRTRFEFARRPSTRNVCPSTEEFSLAVILDSMGTRKQELELE